MTKLLLTSVIRPFGGPGEGDSVGAELFHAQVTRAQGPFSLRQVIRCWAIDYIAENLLTPTVTLHYPSRREFIQELTTGGYTDVGINFVVSTFHKMVEMVGLIRKHAPNARIILGGYGTILPDETLREHGDAFCREEGIGFMRRLLGEPMDRPIRHPHAPIPSVSVLGFQLPTVVGHVTAGLGCPNGCDFCCTSHFFERRYQRLSHSGRELYESFLKTRERSEADGQHMSGFIMIDEDFFLFHKRAREFLDCVREGGEAIQIMGFGSVRGLSKFTAREIAEMGFTLVWTAFEGKGSGYGKLQGRPITELYRDLKSVGCAQLTSMIIGFPYQDEATIRRELEEVMELEPGLLQCLIYMAFPGTPFHKQVIAEGRYRREYQDAPDFRTWDGFSMHFDHPHFKDPRRVEVLQREIYSEDFRRLGPSPLRLARVWLTGYETLRHDENPLLRQRAEQLRQDVRGILPVVSATIAFGPSLVARRRALALRRDIIRLTGELSTSERVMETGSPLMYIATRAARAMGVFQQPGLLRTEHRTGSGQDSLHTRQIRRLQGGVFSGALRSLAEDAARHVDRLRSLGRSTERPRPLTAPELRTVTTQHCDLPRSLPVVQQPCPAALADAAE